MNWIFEENVPKLEMLASLQRQLRLGLAGCALQSQHDLLRSLGLLVENRLCLTTITGLFAIITTLSLREQRSLIQIVRYNSTSQNSTRLYRTFPALYCVTLC